MCFITWIGKNGSRKNAPPGKLPPWRIAPRKIAPMKFLCEFFLISNFYFYENFCLKMKNGKSTFIQFIFLL